MATEADSEPSLSTKRLEGKVAVITGGAATGIGRAAVRMFVAYGAFVLFGDIQDKLGADLVQELAPRASFLQCDVMHEKDVAALVDAVIATYGRLDIMYNNASIAGPQTLSVQDFDVTFMDFIYNVNIRSAILGTKHAERVMIPAKTGVIVATASTASQLMGAEPVPHNVGCLAMAGLIRSASADLTPHGIRDNCISSAHPPPRSRQFRRRRAQRRNVRNTSPRGEPCRGARSAASSADAVAEGRREGGAVPRQRRRELRHRARALRGRRPPAMHLTSQKCRTATISPSVWSSHVVGVLK